MRSKNVLLFALLLVAAMFASTAFAQNTADPATAAEITNLIQAGSKASLANDPSFVKERYADDYTGGSSWGNWDTKASTLKDMSDPKANKTNKDVISDIKVRAHGNTAIATYNHTYDQLYHGEKRARTVMCTDTWIKDGAAWKLAASHCSQLAK
jgi:hypothetical protein